MNQPVTINRTPRGKGLRGKAARARKQHAGALHLEHLRSKTLDRPTRPDPATS